MTSRLDYNNYHHYVIMSPQSSANLLSQSSAYGSLTPINGSYTVLIEAPADNLYFMGINMWIRGADGIEVTFLEDDGITAIPNVVSII